jgi:hypothetical protein
MWLQLVGMIFGANQRTIPMNPRIGKWEGSREERVLGLKIEQTKKKKKLGIKVKLKRKEKKTESSQLFSFAFLIN